MEKTKPWGMWILFSLLYTIIPAAEIRFVTNFLKICFTFDMVRALHDLQAQCSWKKFNEFSWDNSLNTIRQVMCLNT